MDHLKPTITLLPFLNSNYCVGSSIPVSFTSNLPNGTTFIVILRSGSTIITSIKSTTSPVNLSLNFNNGISYDSDFTIQISALGVNFSNLSPNLSIGNISKSQIVDVNEDLLFSPDYLCVGSTKVYNALAKDLLDNSITSGLKYQWRKDGVDISGAVNQSMSASQSGIYDVIITQAGCKHTASSIQLIVSSSPFVILKKFSDMVACVGTAQKIEAAYYSNTATYQWQKNGNDIGGANKSEYFAFETGLYKVNIKDGGCVLNSYESKVVFSTGISADIFVRTGDTTICGKFQGKTLGTSNNPFNPNQYEYQWKKDGIDIIGATYPTYTTLEGGVFSVTYKQGNCVSTSRGVTILNSNKAQKPSITAGEITNLCSGSVMISQRKNDDTFISLSGIWYKDGVAISNISSTSYTAISSGVYKMVNGIGNCANESNEEKISIGTILSPKIYVPSSFNSKTNLCGTGDFILLQIDNRNLSGGTFNYQWQKNGLNILGATSGAMYVYTPGNYSLLVTNGNCTAISNTIIITNNAPILYISTSDNNLSCTNRAVRLDIRGGTSSFTSPILWKRDGVMITGETSSFLYTSQKGNYTATINQNGCIGTTTGLLLNTALSVNLSIQAPSSVDYGQTATLTASNCAGTVKWYDAATSGNTLGTGSSYTTPVLSATTTYYASCTVNDCESTTRGSAVVTVNGSNPCPPTITHTGSIASGTYSASGTIISTVNVPNNTKYYAGQSVTLSTGFSAGPNENFEVRIQGCNTTPTAQTPPPRID